MLVDDIDFNGTCHQKEHHHHSHSAKNSLETHQDGGREIKVLRRVLDANDMIAEANRKCFSEKRIFVLNLMSSPGSGKTTLLQKTLTHLMAEFRCGVIVGDICTTVDAERLATTGAPVVQINTDAFGGDCHLAAHVVEKALAGLDLDSLEVLIVENIGNLVCPAEFDIGEDRRVVVLSVTEGEDKPLKYPLMFRVCDAALLNKIDLLPYLDYDVDLAVSNILRIHPSMPVFKASAKTGEGFHPWLEWIASCVQKKLK